MTAILAIVKALVTFGPDVVSLIGDIVELVKKTGSTKDRKKAERAIYFNAWAKHHGLDANAVHEAMNNNGTQG